MPYPLLILTDEDNNLIVELHAASNRTTLNPKLKFYVDSTGNSSFETTYPDSLEFNIWY